MFTSFFLYIFAYMEEYVVNRKQFKFLADKFLKENRLVEKWYHDAMTLRDNNYKFIDRKFNLSEDDDYPTRLDKCIDIYIGTHPAYYEGCIYGFFRYIPSGGCDFGYNWENFWRKYSDMWEEKYEFVKYEKY